MRRKDIKTLTISFCNLKFPKNTSLITSTNEHENFHLKGNNFENFLNGNLDSLIFLLFKFMKEIECYKFLPSQTKVP